ncbi:mycofactocin-associated electron transfer flavoprotein beta subunit [Amycolatopsis alkalitolerans]|uniref:Putative mycofactocin-associated electron transfer flavoprotein n=1 Tax=Amycolatopsis alkalitolerans TaxID=2547244 RepID=A0A5C4M7X0_9PSEU|nr:mycofactocin-associated electron transfer flavoprotein beta subunit [Amycolatopsis alkalitolerans]TNC28983.1 putative mycofactocin-associated electron transfer flavoprotein [Amycolatopsis alkalitolerans]
MLVVAALRWSDQRAAVDPLTGEVRTDVHTSGASAADRAALEHALRIAEAFGARCLAVTVGPAEADDMLRDALSSGAHEVVRVDGPPATVAEDGSATARLLLAGLPERPDVVVCGDHSADRGTGSTPAFLAQRLGACQALGLIELSAADGALHAVRRLDGGRRERLRFGLPAVCSVEPAGVVLRRAPLPATIAARTAEIPVVRAGVLESLSAGAVKAYRPRPRALPAPVGAEPHQRVLALTGALVERTPPKVVRPETAEEAARELLDYLRRHGYAP